MSTLTDLRDRVAAERLLTADARESGATDRTLDGIHALLDQACLLEEKGNHEAIGPVLDRVAWHVTDSFRMDSELGRDLLRHKQAFRKKAGKRSGGGRGGATTARTALDPQPSPGATAAATPAVPPSPPATPASPVAAPAAPAPNRRRLLVLVACGVLLAVLWPTLIWAATEFNMPALRMIASWSIAAVAVVVISLVAGWFRDRRR